MTSAPTTAVFSREQAVLADADDPLAAFRDRYLPQTDDVVAYLDGNSLGRPLASIGDAWATFTQEQWAGRLIRGWSEGWMELPEIVGDELAAAALGAAAGQTVIADSTTVNFYKSMRAALNLRPGRRKVVLDRDNFPTNRYVVESLARDLDLELIWLQAGSRAAASPPTMSPPSVDDRHRRRHPEPRRLSLRVSRRREGDHRHRPPGRCARRLGPLPFRRVDRNQARRLGCRFRRRLHLQVRRRRTRCARPDLRESQTPRAHRPADLGLVGPPGFLRDGAGFRPGERCAIDDLRDPARCSGSSPSGRAPR